MKAAQSVKEILNRNNTKQAALADRLGIKPAILSSRLKQDNISIDKLNEMLRVLDYKIVILPRDARIPEGGIEIE